MSAQSLPERPNLDQLKRQAKDLLKSWEGSPPAGVSAPRLRDAQRAIAERYGFASWDALRSHVTPAAKPPHRGLLYDDPIADVVVLSGPITDDVIRSLAGARVASVKIDESVPAASLRRLSEVPTLTGLDLSGRGDLVDEDVRFVGDMPALAQVNLRWTATGDGAAAALAGKRNLSRIIFGSRLTDAGVARLLEFPAVADPGSTDSFVSISGGRTLTDGALEIVSRLAGLAALDVHTSAFGSPLFTARGVAHLKKMPSLDSLNFHGHLATDAVLREIAAIPRLRWLHCQDIVSGDDGFLALGRCGTLEWLATRICSTITDRGFEAVARLPRLTTLSMGGPSLSESAMAPLTESQTLVDLTPTLSRDEAFRYIGRIPRLERLTNMYNRATTDRATRHLANSPSLKHYGAFGTQITDESLRVLATLPRLERIEIDNCLRVTDEGLAALVRKPNLKRLGVAVCGRVTGTWMKSAPAGVETSWDPGSPEFAAFYLAETLLDHPDLPVPGDLVEPSGAPPSPEAFLPLACFGSTPAFTPEGLRLAAPSRGPARSAGVITRDALTLPVRLEIVVRPLAELRLVFGAHNQEIAFDGHGRFVDVAPWFLRSKTQKGTPHGDGVQMSDGEWVRVTLENDAAERRLLVNGVLWHSWRGDYAGLRSRLGIGARSATLTIRSLKTLG